MLGLCAGEDCFDFYMVGYVFIVCGLVVSIVRVLCTWLVCANAFVGW